MKISRIINQQPTTLRLNNTKTEYKIKQNNSLHEIKQLFNAFNNTSIINEIKHQLTIINTSMFH